MRVAGAGAVITGGASGLGAACARVLAQAGARVTILDLDPARGTETASACGGRFEAADVRDEAAVERALDGAERAHGATRILVNCAGVPGAGMRVSSRRGPHSREAFERIMSVHAFGTFNVMRLCAARMTAAPALEDGERGVIVNTSSIVAADGPVGMIAYAAAKGATEAMTLPAARDLGPAGIRVACIAAGSFATPMLETMPPEMRERNLTLQPFPKRAGSPEEFAALVKHICENPMINGAVLRLDGAQRLHISS
jgi:NAD(P)-dependent dehydrogenase (short-subunit alcohol dehydrogenase family)